MIKESLKNSLSNDSLIIFIQNSDKNMFYMYLGNDGLYYNYYDADGCIVHKGKLISDMDLDFTKYSFSLDKDDNIYCI